MKIQKILYNLRETKGLTQQEIAEILGVDIKTYNRYEKGLHEIKLGVLLKLATYYNLSLDFLTGLIETPRSLEDKKEKYIQLTTKQKKLLKAYSDNPKLQEAVDILLNIK